MVDKKILLKEFILNNPSLKASEIYSKTKGTSLGTRKTEVLKLVREVRNVPEPTIAKKEASTPIKFRTPTQKKRIKQRVKPKPKISKPKVSKPKVSKPTKQLKLPVKIEFKDTKFGKITKRIQNKHGLSEEKAIIRARALLKIPRMDFDKLNEIDLEILEHFGY